MPIAALAVIKPEAIRDSVIRHLQGCGIASTKGIAISKVTSQLLGKIRTDFQAACDPRDWIGGEIRSRNTSCLINRFL